MSDQQPNMNEVNLERIKAILAAIPQRWSRQGATFAQAATTLSAALAAAASYSDKVPEGIYYVALLLSYSVACVYFDDESAAWLTDHDLHREFGVTLHPVSLRRFKQTTIAPIIIRRFRIPGFTSNWFPTAFAWMAYGRTAIFFWPAIAFFWPGMSFWKALFTLFYLAAILVYTYFNITVHLRWCGHFDQIRNGQIRAGDGNSSGSGASGSSTFDPSKIVLEGCAEGDA